MDQFFYALAAILQPTIALLFQVHFFLRGNIKCLKTLKLQDHTYQDHFCSMCPRSLELSSSYTTNHDDKRKSLFLSGNQESVFMADSIDDRSSGFTPDDGRGSSWVAINFQFISSRFDLFPEWIKLQFCSYAEVFVGNAPYLYSLHRRFNNWQKVSCLKWIRLPWISFACCQFPTFLTFFCSD